MAIFHLRLRSAPDDFLLLTPSDPAAEDSGMTAYQTPGTKLYFCAKCGVRPFGIFGQGEHAEVEAPVDLLGKLGLQTEGSEGGTAKVKVWRPKKGWQEGIKDYFSLNMVTLDAYQEHLDLRQLYEKGYIRYDNQLDSPGEDGFEKPCVGGMY
ncbi:hypothetical protein MMC20_005162 [Loxospora ochrophaea]|nr:hypothetical protein [Loxospora ochrophaea]